MALGFILFASFFMVVIVVVIAVIIIIVSGFKFIQNTKTTEVTGRKKQDSHYQF